MATKLINPAYELVGDIYVSSTSTSVDFTGLNFTSSDDLYLVSDIYNSSGSYTNYRIFANSNTTTTNYYMQQIYVDSASLYVGRANVSKIGEAYSGKRGMGITRIKLTNSNYIVAQTNSADRISPSPSSELMVGSVSMTSTFTLTTINSLTISAEVSNSIGIGSRFRLYKLNATKVADITVGTATTSVDITGLSIDNSSEYMLVSDVYNPLVANTAYSLFSNNNTTQTNYYRQYLFADNTTIGSGRLNQAYYMDIDSVKSALCYTNIKLTNSGNIIYQANFNNRYGTSSQFIQMNNMTSTFTSTNITQLTITSNTTNGIGVGSRFQLYKLR